MILQIIASISLVYSVSAAVEYVQVTLSDVTSGFNGDINAIIPYPGDPSILVVADEYALWKFNPQTKEKSRIAGSSSAGYTEGTGGEARFNDLLLAQFDETTIIAADDNNYCVRLINVETKSTERYAGLCQSGGDDDGDRLSSKMGYVWGITRVGNEFYIADRTYKKIRRISGNTMSTLFTETLALSGITSFGNKLIYSFDYGLGEFDLVTGLRKHLSGGENSGFEDGTLKNAKYRNGYEINWIAENILLVAGTSNHAVRLVDLNGRKVTSIDLSARVVTVQRYLGDIYIGLSGGIIKKFPVTEIAGVCPGLDGGPVY